MRIAKTILNIIREGEKCLKVKNTEKLRDTETVMRSLEGGGWKSANIGNSLAAYPTARTVLRGERGSDAPDLPDGSLLKINISFGGT